MFLKQIRILPLLILFLLISCAGEPPEVLETWWQLNVVHESGTDKFVESLSLFIHGEDEDGEDDLDQIYLINDDLSTLWNISSDLWATHRENNVNWIGFNGLRAPGDGTFPEGNYRLLLVDIGGERDESSLYLRNPIPQREEIIIPEITITSNGITVRSDFPKFQLWFYDSDGMVIEISEDLLMGIYEWNGIVRNINRRAASFSLYTEPETGSWGLVSGPYYFNQ